MSCCAMLSFAVEDQMCIPLAFLFISQLWIIIMHPLLLFVSLFHRFPTTLDLIPDLPQLPPPLSASASEEFVYAFECDLVSSLFSFF